MTLGRSLRIKKSGELCCFHLFFTIWRADMDYQGSRRGLDFSGLHCACHALFDGCLPICRLCGSGMIDLQVLLVISLAGLNTSCERPSLN
jgi:hypothetical protein